MSGTMNIEIPPGLTELLQSFTVEVLRQRPPDLLGFAADYFTRRRDAREQEAAGGRRVVSFDGEPMQTESNGEEEPDRRDEDSDSDFEREYGRRGAAAGGCAGLCGAARGGEEAPRAAGSCPGAGSSPEGQSGASATPSSVPLSRPLPLGAAGRDGLNGGRGSGRVPWQRGCCRGPSLRGAAELASRPEPLLALTPGPWTPRGASFPGWGVRKQLHRAAV